MIKNCWHSLLLPLLASILLVANVPAGAAESDFVPVATELGNDTIVYMLSPENGTVERLQIFTNEYLPPISVGTPAARPSLMVFHPGHNRLYFGYADGKISFIQLGGSLTEQQFGALPLAVQGLAHAGNYLLAQDDSGAWSTHYIFSADGILRDSKEWNRYSRAYAWNATLQRVYFFRDNTSPNDLHYEEIDQQTGLIVAAGETPYHGDYSMVPPIRVSQDGSKVLLGSGDLFAADSMTWIGSLPGGFADAAWNSDGGAVFLFAEGPNARVERRGVDGTLLETRVFNGAPLRVIALWKGFLVITDQGQPAVNLYKPSDDSDDDGVANLLDAFPQDPAASLDTDNDGYPDAWNPGKSAADSNTGLMLDAYPEDTACYLIEHGAAGVCDVGSTMPDFVPETIAAGSNGILYLFSPENYRVYRWDVIGQKYLNPIIVGQQEYLATNAPDMMRYHPAHRRLYFSYADGEITYVDIDGELTEQYFVTNPTFARGMQAAGNYLWVAARAAGTTARYQITYRPDGIVADIINSGYYSQHTAWNQTLSRVYMFRDGTSPNDLLYQTVDQSTGTMSGTVDSPYHGSYAITPPIRISVDGSRVLLGSGDIYSAEDLTWLGALPGGFADAAWLPDGSIVLLYPDAAGTRAERRASDGQMMETRMFTGEPLYISPIWSSFLVITDEGKPAVHLYKPSDDSDSDGVPNTVDEFPLDPAASIDADNDGYPDSWNPGMTAEDSTTGLILDTYPTDSACWLPEHGDGGVCDIARTLPDFVPEVVELGLDNTLYMFSPENNRVYRWDVFQKKYINPIVIGSDEFLGASAPQIMALHRGHNRLYFGYDDGTITYIDLNGDLTEQYFANLPQAVRGLTYAGNFLLAQDNSGAWETHFIFSADGILRDQAEWNHYSRVYDWNETLNRMYFFRDTSSPNDLMYEDIDPVTGLIIAKGETPYHGDYTIAPPIRISPDDSKVLLGSGDIYDAASMTWLGSISSQFVDAAWGADGSIVTATANAGQSQIVRRAADGRVLESRSFTGIPLRIIPLWTNYLVVADEGKPAVYLYKPTDDSDNDGVPNLEDAFPLDPAAAIDSDGDGYPDAWNPGKTIADSTTGLVLDAYPVDTACYLYAHGDGTTCDISSMLPAYQPVSTAMDGGGIVYLFSPENHRVYRWDSVTEQHLNPIVIGSDDFLDSTTPDLMIYHANHFRLYFGYASGEISYVDLAGEFKETYFATMPDAVRGLGEAGNFVLGQDNTGAWYSHFIYSADGELRDQVEWNRYSRMYAWNEQLNRIYFFRDATGPNDLHYEEIDQTTGIITDSGETPYHGGYSMITPIRVSPDGTKVLLGSGDIFAADTMTHIGALPYRAIDTAWLPWDAVAIIRENTVDTALHIYNRFYEERSAVIIPNPPVALFHSNFELLIITQGEAGPEFHKRSLL